MDFALQHGYVDLLKTLNYNEEIYFFSFRTAVALGHFNIVRFLTKNLANSKFKSLLCYWSAYASQFKIMKWAIKRGYPAFAHSLRIAVKLGDLKLVKFLSKRKLSKTAGSLPRLSAEFNKFDITKWAIKRGHFYDLSVCRFAAKHGNLAFLKWMVRTNKFRIDNRTIKKLIIYNHTHILKWIKRQGKLQNIVRWTIKLRRLEVLKCLLQHEKAQNEKQAIWQLVGED